jgi:IS30 family transposase
MTTQFKHLTIIEREKILLFRGKGLSIRDIAKRLNRQPSTISRELKRNNDEYSPAKAEKRAKRERVNSRLGKLKILIDPLLYNYVFDKLESGWSPEQIAGRVNKDLGLNIVHETIYQFIYSYFGRKYHLPKYLRRSHSVRKQKRATAKYEKRGRIPNRIDISKRPKEVELRKRIGHWEGDTIIGKGHRSSIVTLVERKTKYLIADLLDNRQASMVSKSIIKHLDKLPSKTKKTITFDNGLEFSDHERITKKAKVKCFFAKPYSSWQRGTNENTNGLIRWYIPKGTDFKELDNSLIQDIVKTLNNRPRKCLSYLTPKEALEQELAKSKCCISD